ncbi:MAG: T9SS type A sorting domain-containing protein [Bacteroidetes bacterium]|nr:T9SS type A sorting domain-containing protein [Bacteroidota bacterium]
MSILDANNKNNSKVLWVFLLVFFIGVKGFCQSGGWDANYTNGTTGYTDWTLGVIQLNNTTSTGCAGAAISETSVTYDPCGTANFVLCYQTFFGCSGGSDDIGSDAGGDGMSFSFSKCAYNINNGACGGGLGYHGACASMITVEFDTYSSQGGGGFDGSYGGGTSGDHDEIAIHRDGNSADAGRITSADAGNLEDGLEHWICFNYSPATHILKVYIDATEKLSYDFTGSSYQLCTYFGAGGLNQTWGAGKNGATNSGTVSNGHDISNLTGAGLGCAILPVELISFTAINKSDKINLYWATASEINNDRFTVERSTNSKQWEAVGEVDGAGNSSSLLLHTFVDEDPLKGVVYYRLKQVDFDGTVAYSGIVSVDSKLKYFKISPNPFDDALLVNGDLQGNTEICVYDVLGRLCYQSSQYVNKGDLKISPELEKGTYLMTIKVGSIVEQQRIIKN